MADITTNKETALLQSRVSDLCQQCRTKYYPSFLGFLDTAQQTVATQLLKHAGISHRFWGGYQDAERVYLGVFPDEEIDTALFPLCCLEFCWREEDSLSHPDFLGALMALQLKRETIGDICVTPGRAYVFLSDHAAELALREVSKIGRVGVTIQPVKAEQVHFTPSFALVSGTAASLRLDCIVALLGNLSRTDACARITAGLVLVDGLSVTSVSKCVAPGEKLSIRGVGKFIFDGQDGVSRKDRLRLKFRKYQ